MTSNHERSCYLYIMPRCDRWSIAYRHPGGHRTSNMLDRLMRGMNRYFDHGQHLHGSLEACRLHCRAWALLWNFALASGDGAGKSRLAVPRRTPQPHRYPHRYRDCLVATPIDLRIAWWIPMSTPPKISDGQRIPGSRAGADSGAHSVPVGCRNYPTPGRRVPYHPWVAGEIYGTRRLELM